MTPFRTACTPLLLLAAAWASGCSIAPPPSIEPMMPRRDITPRSYKMKLAVFNLTDQTGAGGKLTESVSEMLHVALFQTKRFELMQRAEIRGIDSRDTRQIQQDYRNRLDGLVVGSITNFTPADKTMTLNVNVMNPFGTTLAARSFQAKYTGTINVQAGREDVDTIAQWIERAFPKLQSGLVIARPSADRITVNLGSESGVTPGMGLLIAARGNIIKDPNTGEVLGSDIYIGEAYVIAVQDAKCTARLAPIEVVVNANGRQQATTLVPQVNVNDKVVFK